VRTSPPACTPWPTRSPATRGEFDRGGVRFNLHVPDEVDFKLEIEIGDDGRELEVELTR
jgi:hypothetical protein